MSRGGAWVVLTSCAIACGQAPQEPTTTTELREGVVARVGQDEIRAETVALIAAQQAITPKQALELAVRDALFASALREREDTAPLVAVAERAALGRALLEELRAQANQAGPPTPGEVQAVIARHWYQVDRPAGARTIHVVALSKEPKDKAPAHAVAEQLRNAVAGAKTAEEFEKAAKQVASPDIEVKVESLPAVAPDGRVVPDKPPLPNAPAGELDKAYATAANALTQPGDQSGIVETAHGFHVIMLLERTPAVVMPEAQRSKVVSREVLADRARALESELVKLVHRKTEVQIDSAARELTARVSVAP